VIRARDQAHARLARRRLAAIGGGSMQSAPRQVQSLCGVLAAPTSRTARSSRSSCRGFRRARTTALPTSCPARRRRDARLLEVVHDDDRASLRWLREAGEEHPADAAADAAVDVLVFLDAFRAAETASADVFGAWRDACALPGLRGGLDTIAEREATHAACCRSADELGGAMRVTVDPIVVADAIERFGAPAESDEQKLGAVAARYPDDAAATPGDARARRARGRRRDAGDAPPDRRGRGGHVRVARSYHRAITAPPREVSLRVLDGGR
jgi:hypothetical protein